jgi:transposase-like protein
MKCPDCGSIKISKNGHRRGKQSYICNHCRRQFIESYDVLGYRESIKKRCLELYFSGMGFRAIERTTGVNHNTVINWVRQAANSLPDTQQPVKQLQKLHS